jgi:hypothetical protein
MPGSSRRPIRPHRVRTWSRDRLCLSSGGGLWGFVFGLVFTVSGTLCLVACGRLLLWAVGILPPTDRPMADLSPGTAIAGLAALLALGGVHLGFGILLFCTRRATFDRSRDSVTVRTGWMGLWSRRDKLSNFATVVVASGSQEMHRFQSENAYDIVLEGEAGRRLVVAEVTRSAQVAREVAAEIAAFTGLTT